MTPRKVVRECTHPTRPSYALAIRAHGTDLLGNERGIVG